MSQISAKVIAASISPQGHKLTTFELVYHRFIHSEFMTHRKVAKNSASSRAIPTAKLLEQVRNSPMMPIHWGQNQKGMQAAHQVEEMEADEAKRIWIASANTAADFAESLFDLGIHKQVANRILEPYVPMRVVATATDWNNFFHLRDHPDAQPEIAELARQMRVAMDAAHYQYLEPGMWHLPYITPADAAECHMFLKHGRITRDEPRPAEVTALLLKISVARCARVSYNNFEGRPSSVQEDLALYEKLVGSSPLHASPTEHQATPDEYLTNGGIGWNVGWQAPHQWGCLTGWVQFRKTLDGEFVPG